MTNQNGKVKTKEGRYVIMYTRIRIFYYQKGSLAGMYIIQLIRISRENIKRESLTH